MAADGVTRPPRRVPAGAVVSAALVVVAIVVLVLPAVSKHHAQSQAEPAAVSSPPRPIGAQAPVVVTATGPAPRATATASVDLSNSPTKAPSTVGVPTLVDIPAIGVHAAIIPLGLLPDGTAAVPTRFDVAGWFTGGPRPGDPGPAVILGHVDSVKGPAVFFRLGRLRAGDIVTVTSATGAQRFAVDSVATYPKAQFPTALVYGPVTDRALRLVTCGGPFDDSRHSYVDNVIVFATAVSQ